MRETHFNGIFSVEILQDLDDNMYFLEVNFRNSTWSYPYTFAGMNLPYQWAKSTLQGFIDDKSATLREKPFRAMVELEYYVAWVRTHKISIFQFLKELFTCDVWFYYNSKDRGVMWHVLKRHLHLC